RRRVLHHGDFIAELSGIANGCFNASMRNEPDDDEFMDAVFLELQIQIGVSEAAGAPMLLDNNFAGLRRERGSELATPRAVLECFSQCTSRSHSRLGGIDDALQRKSAASPSERH